MLAVMLFAQPPNGQRLSVIIVMRLVCGSAAHSTRLALNYAALDRRIDRRSSVTFYRVSGVVYVAALVVARFTATLDSR